MTVESGASCQAERTRLVFSLLLSLYLLYSVFSDVIKVPVFLLQIRVLIYECASASASENAGADPCVARDR